MCKCTRYGKRAKDCVEHFCRDASDKTDARVDVRTGERTGKVGSFRATATLATTPIVFGYPTNLEETYEIFYDKCLGSGAFGNVYRWVPVFCGCAWCTGSILFHIQRQLRACMSAALKKPRRSISYSLGQICADERRRLRSLGSPTFDPSARAQCQPGNW
jgi:hypothetical protein